MRRCALARSQDFAKGVPLSRPGYFDEYSPSISVLDGWREVVTGGAANRSRAAIVHVFTAFRSVVSSGLSSFRLKPVTQKIDRTASAFDLKIAVLQRNSPALFYIRADEAHPARSSLQFLRR